MPAEENIGPMPPSELREALLRHVPADDLERASIAEFLEALEHLEKPFDEDADPTHVTASAIIVGPRGTVLHVHKRVGRWLQPGGHVDRGEAPPAAALREAEEETGLAVAHPAGGAHLLHVDVHPGPRGHTHLDLRYLLVAPDDDPSPPPDESPEVRWFAWDEAIAMADGGLATALRQARQRWEDGPEPGPAATAR